MKKNILLFVFTLLSTLTANAYDAQVDGIYYTLIAKAKQAEVTSGDTEYTGSVTIPESFTYNGVTYSVTSIGEDAFYYSEGLTSVTIPNSVTSIGDYAFRDCSGLTSITIPNSVTSVGNHAFDGCSKLTSVHITDIAAWCKIIFGNYLSNPLYYAHHLFMDGKEITDLVIPNSVTSIGDYAFYDCTGLTSIEIPNSVTSIGKSAFSGCSGLTSVIIPNSVTSIGNAAFSYCTGLTSIEIPNSVTSIGDYAFSGCSKLTSVTIPNSVTSIGDYAFFSCSGLTSITIPNSVTSIGSSAFRYCSSLTSITIPNSVTSIGNSAFDGCSKLTSITIPNSVTSIGSSAFWNCSGLTSVKIGSGVKNISNSAFASCSKLADVYCYAEDVPTTGNNALNVSPISTATLHVPAASINAYQTTSPWSEFGTIVALDGCEPTPAGIAINETNFPDENFRNWILSQEYGKDGVLTDAEIAEVTFIAIYEKNVQSLQGIEFFTALESLQCMRNQLTSLDVSKNTLLRVLGCDENQLTSLDLSKNTLLMILDCSYNKFTSLDVSNLTALESLQCHDNQLTSLDVSNTALVYIECYRNQLKGAAMEAFVKGLPEITSGKEWDGLLYIVCNEDEGNEMTTSQVAAAQAKGWKPYYYDGEKNSWEPYDDIKPVLRGDVNEDGVVNGTDIQEVINIIVNAD